MASVGAMVLRWNPAYRLGVAEIDSQHARLIELIERLHLACAAGAAEFTALSVLAELVDYTQYHFATEDGLMDRYGYVESAAHRNEHLKFHNNVSRFVDDFVAGTPGVPAQLVEFLEGWLTGHIGGTDRIFCEFLKQQGVR